MDVPRTPTAVLVQALRVLAAEIQSGDGVANAALANAAERLDEFMTVARDAAERAWQNEERVRAYAQLSREARAIDFSRPGALAQHRALMKRCQVLDAGTVVDFGPVIERLMDLAKC